jgi:hypothetical protein
MSRPEPRVHDGRHRQPDDDGGRSSARYETTNETNETVGRNVDN